MPGPRILDEQVKAFRDVISLWKPADTEVAMACQDLEDLLRAGIYLYEFHEAEDRRFRLLVAEGKEPYDPKKDAEIEATFDWWLRPCTAIEKRIRAFEKSGFRVEGAEKFRTYHRLAREASRDRRIQPARG